MKYLIIITIFICTIFLTSCEKKYSISNYTVPDPDYPANSIGIDSTINPADYILTSSNVILLDFGFDSENRLWILTNQGLVKIDKIEEEFIFSSFLTNEKYAKTITIDNLNNLWINTAYGLVYYNTQQDNFSIFTAENADIPTNSTSKVYIDETNTPYLVHNQGVMKFENYQWTEDDRFPPISSFDDEFPTFSISKTKPLIVKKDDYFWLATGRGLLKYKNDSTFEYYTPENSFLADYGTESIYKDNQNDIWISTGSEIQKIDNEEWTEYSGVYNFSITEDYMLSEDYPYGIKLFTNNQWKDIFEGYYFKIYSYNDSRVDKDGNLWLSDYTKIYKINPEVIQ